MWKKRQIVEAAFRELALAGYTFDLSAEELNAGLIQLDTMMASWPMRLPYAYGLTPDDTDLDQDSGVPLRAIDAVVKKLAIAISASKGKQLSRSTVVGAKAAYDALLSWVARSEVQSQKLRGGMPLGAGNRTSEGPAFSAQPSTDPLQVSDSGQLQFLGD